MPFLKTIQYRGGIARFQIPASWVEEYELQGGGTFYEPVDDTGTLRINVLGFDRKADSRTPAPTAFDLLACTRSGDEVEVLPSGAAIARYVTHAEERGENLRIHNWQIGICVPPTHFRIVVFTYAIVEGQERDPKMMEKLKLLDRLIATGEYPAVEGVAGDYYHEPVA